MTTKRPMSFWRQAQRGQAFTGWIGMQGVAALGIVMIMGIAAGGDFGFFAWVGTTVTESHLFGDGGGSTGSGSTGEGLSGSSSDGGFSGESEQTYGYGDDSPSLLMGEEVSSISASAPRPVFTTLTRGDANDLDHADNWLDYQGAPCDACYENFVNGVKGYEYDGEFRSRTDPEGSYRFRTQADADEYDALMRGTTFNPADGQVYNPDGSVMSDYLYSYSQSHAFYN